MGARARRIKLNRPGEYYITPVNHFHYININTVVKGAQTKHPTKYYQTPLILDTETSHNHSDSNPIGWIYQWCMEWHGEYCIGRSVDEIIKTLRWVYDNYKLSDDNRVYLCITSATTGVTLPAFCMRSSDRERSWRSRAGKYYVFDTVGWSLDAHIFYLICLWLYGASVYNAT